MVALHMPPLMKPTVEWSKLSASNSSMAVNCPMVPL
jgi:hypothetical protein